MPLRFRPAAWACALSAIAVLSGQAAAVSGKQRSLQEWVSLTSPTNPPPRVFVRGDNVRFYFHGSGGVEGFKADWKRLRVPARDYRVNSALLHFDQRLPRVPGLNSQWREAQVIAGEDWRRLSTNLLDGLTPATPGHAVFFQAFLADGLLYRDATGVPRLASDRNAPPGLVTDHRYSIDETLEILASRIETELARSHPGETLFLILSPGMRRFTQPLLVDRQRRQCVWFAPAALYDLAEGQPSVAATAQSAKALLLESHLVALVKNPLSSAARLADLGVQTAVRLLRQPLPRSQPKLPLPAQAPGMDLVEWEKWLDRYTGTRQKAGTLSMLIDGDRFFTRLQESLSQATNHIHFNLYIFDQDDVAVAIADKLKARAEEIPVQLILDRMGSLGAGTKSPDTPLPENFLPPNSIVDYLDGSKVRVRSFLNPWFSSDHSKVFLVDGKQAWLGGMNLGREYRFEWHDLMVELQGPVVDDLEEEFRHMWAHASPLGDLAYAASFVSGRPGPRDAAASLPPPPENSEGWTQVRLLPTKTGWKPFSTAVLGSLRKARNYIYVQHPYLFDKHVLIQLVQARRRGVDVRVILPRVNDFKAGGRSNLVTANYLLSQGVRVYFYPGMTHAKALLVDDWACLGSANLNHLSMRLCQEQNVATSDPDFTARLKQDLFETDFTRSYELTEPLVVDWVDFLSDLVLQGF